MTRRTRKYLFTALSIALFGQMVFGTFAPGANAQSPVTPVRTVRFGVDSTRTNPNAMRSILDPRGEAGISADTTQQPVRSTHPDSVPPTGRFLPTSYYENDTITPANQGQIDSANMAAAAGLTPDSIPPAADTARREPRQFLDEKISGRNKDSLVYDVKNGMVYIYREGDITYEDMNLKADYMEVSLDTKIVYGYGIADSTGVKTRPEFTEGGTVYTMDTLTYNIDNKKAKIKGAATQEGEGFLVGRDIKKMEDNTVNIAGGRYTTCDHIDHPHYYLAMTKAKLIPGKKVIIGPSYMVLEDVPIYFPLIPFGFFPISSGRNSGFIMPSVGEETVKGFFIREGGYYFAFNDYIDMTLLGGIYTLGSWEAAVSSRYIKRYTYSGGLNFRFTRDIIGEKGDADYVNMKNFSLQWTHTQDAKFRPNSTFSASVNFSTSGYSTYGANNMTDRLNTQTNSSITYSKNWAGKPFSFSASMRHSQNSRDTTVTLSFPTMSFNMSRITPFKSADFMGREKWYHKIQLSYTATADNNVTVKERDFLSGDMFKNMRNGINHNIPVSGSFNLFNYLNINPSVNYRERWYFRKYEREYDPAARSTVVTDTTYGFYRVWDYNLSASATTKIYGQFDFTGKNPVIKAIRHVMTPSVSFQYTPDFGDPKYGYYKPIQTDSTGTIGYYSPYEGAMYGVPGRGKNMALSFSIQNTLEAKVRSEKDTSGVRKLKLIDNLSLSGSYNFLADSMKLSTIAINMRTTLFKSFGVNVNMTFDPYQVNEDGYRINKFALRDGKLARLTNLSTSFGYTINSGTSNIPAVNNINSSITPTAEDADFFARNNVDPNTQRMMMTSQYYDFSIPWNLGFNYSLSYSNTGRDKRVTQTLGFNGSLTLTEKWGVTFNGGYDFETNKITPGVVTITRDLHCWQMNLSWVPVGFSKSWSFNISVKSAVLRDLKYDKRSSQFDNLLD